MSNYYIKNYLNDIFNESDSFIPQKEIFFNLISQDNTSSFIPQNGGSYSLTSQNNTSSNISQNGSSYSLTSQDNTSSFIPQNSGSYSLTSINKTNNNEVNKLITMLESDSTDSTDSIDNNFSDTSIATEKLRNKLINILQDGGSKKRKKNKKFVSPSNQDQINKHCVYYNKTDSLPHYEINLKQNKREMYDPSFKGSANTHLGQRKLMLSEMQLLNEYYKLYHTDSVITIISVGSAAGHHLIQLNEMYPKTKWILIDPSPFDKRLSNRPDTYTIINELFTDEICDQLKKKLKNEKYLFVSDIRRSEVDFEAGVVRDMQLQYDWVKKLLPLLSLLKFRMNYKMKKGDTLSYLNGKLLYGIWTTPVSGETRLLVKQDDINNKDKIYDFNDYEEIMFYHNKNERTTCFSKYQNKTKYKNFIENKNNLYCECFDCLQELNILFEYSELYKKDFNQVVKNFNNHRDMKNKFKF